jgi:dihydropyrimidinase
VYAESCPQYLFLTADDIDLPGVEGAKFCCSPPPRDARSQQSVWDGFKDGTLGLYSSDHAPYRFDETGKLPNGQATIFKDMANGVPGIELRMPLLFSEGVLKNRITINEFVALTASNHARMYGLAHCKGDIAIGMDADLALWNPAREVTVSAAMLHDNVGYTPYEGMRLQGWPELVMSRGRTVVENNSLNVARGSGRYIARRQPEVTVNAKASGSASRLPGLLGLKGKAWQRA